MTDGGEESTTSPTSPSPPGGSLLLAASGRFIGPGHAAIFQEHGREWLSFHYYDGERDGLPWIEVGPGIGQATDIQGMKVWNKQLKNRRGCLEKLHPGESLKPRARPEGLPSENPEAFRLSRGGSFTDFSTVCQTLVS